MDRGTGKTHLAIAIATKQLRDGYKVRFYNLVDLANQLEREKAMGNPGRLSGTIEKLDILVLDELGYLPFAKNSAQAVNSIYYHEYILPPQLLSRLIWLFQSGLKSSGVIK